MDKPYSDLVLQAEKSVSAVKDPELRRVAFEKILDDLLSKPEKGIKKTVSSKDRSGPSISPVEGKGIVKPGGPLNFPPFFGQKRGARKVHFCRTII